MEQVIRPGIVGAERPLRWGTPTKKLAPYPCPARVANKMRLSRFFLPVLRETPKEAEIVSHQLMLRAGLIRQ